MDVVDGDIELLGSIMVPFSTGNLNNLQLLLIALDGVLVGPLLGAILTLDEIIFDRRLLLFPSLNRDKQLLLRFRLGLDSNIHSS